MRDISYHRHEPFREHPEHRSDLLAYFLLDLPYLFYFGVIPSRPVINQFLADGGGGGGMSPGASWEPFEILEQEYVEVVTFWENMVISEKLAEDRFRYDPLIFIRDPDVLMEADHLAYLEKSREKFESTYL